MSFILHPRYYSEHKNTVAYKCCPPMQVTSALDFELQGHWASSRQRGCRVQVGVPTHIPYAPLLEPALSIFAQRTQPFPGPPCSFPWVHLWGWTTLQVCAPLGPRTGQRTIVCGQGSRQSLGIHTHTHEALHGAGQGLATERERRQDTEDRFALGSIKIFNSHRNQRI